MSQLIANIHPEAKIGKNVIIEPFATIERNVEIGDGTWIGPHAVILSGSRIGKNCKIYAGAVIAQIPQDLKFDGEKSLTIIGDNTSIREYCTISRGTVDKFQTTIGANCLLMAYVHVAHDCIIGDHVILVNGCQVGGHVEIADHAIISGLCAVHQFVKIGQHVMLAGGCVARKDIPPFVRAGKSPVKFSGVNIIGLRRRGYTADQINTIREAYRILYQSGLNNTAALKTIESDLADSSEKEIIVNFLKNSTRGIIPAHAGRAVAASDDDDL